MAVAVALAVAAAEEPAEQPLALELLERLDGPLRAPALLLQPELELPGWGWGRG